MSDSNRIGASCWYKLADNTKPLKTLAEGQWRGGKLRAWSTDCDECEGNYGLFPVGVIEDDEHGTCHSIYVTRICFGVSPPV